MSISLREQFTELEQLVGTALVHPSSDDATLEGRVEALSSRLKELDLAPGGLLDRFGLFNTLVEGNRSVLLDHNAAHPQTVRASKYCLMLLARTELWGTRRDTEMLRDKTGPLEERITAQSYRMVRWATALLGAGLERYAGAYGSLWSSVLTTLHLRTRLIRDAAVWRACRSLLRMLWMEPLHRSLAASVPVRLVADWVRGDASEQEALCVARTLHESVNTEEGSMLPECIFVLIEGPRALLKWAESQLDKDPLPEPSERIMTRCSLEVLCLRLAPESQSRLPGAFQRSSNWVSRLRNGCGEALRPQLLGLVGRQTPHWWPHCFLPEELTDPQAVTAGLCTLFPRSAEALGDRLAGLVTDWMQGQVVPILDDSLREQLALLAILGVHQRHADGVRPHICAISQRLFSRPDETGAVSQREAWEIWAPLARLLPEEAVLEALSEAGGLGAHLRAIVESGHPRFAARLLDRAEGLDTLLEASCVEMIQHLHTAGRQTSWSWWAFLMAKGPRTISLDRSRGSPTAQLSGALAQVTHFALVSGREKQEIDIVLAGLMLRGASPHRSGGNPWGSSAEQLYLLQITRSAEGNTQQRRRLLEHLDQLLGVRSRSSE